ncbi:MAG: LytR/AlgR family response regulator transcription factor [Chitinophagales bacterium]
MIKSIIVDDEQHCIDRLKGFLQSDYSNSVELAGEFSSVADGFNGVNDLKPDLIFLDVQIHDKTGFDLLREIGRTDFEVIFTTAYDKFAVQAIKLSALDYLLKPIDKDELKLAINKYHDRKKKSDSNQRLEVLLQNTRPQNGIPGRIIVPTSSGFEIFDVTEIMRCESTSNYTTIYLKNKQKLMVAKTLKEFEDMLTEHGFFRIHNSHLVNLAYIKSYNRGKGGSVILTDGMELDVSTRRKEDFLKKISGE